MGTTRVLTDASGNNLIQCGQNSTYPQGSFLTYAPFGGELDCTQSQTDYKFAGKPRDEESGLDYFGARYNASTLGRFLSPDPIQANELRIVNPQRWNEYAYSLNNPTTFTDPDGEDAIAVGFTSMVHGLGHAGIISVHSDGTAIYARFGPKTEGQPIGPGQVQSVGMPKVEFGPDGLPTKASYEKIARAVARFEHVSSGKVDFAYFKTSSAETAALDAWIRTMQEASDKGHAPLYVGVGQNCLIFCLGGLSAANVKRAGLVQTEDPRIGIQELEWLSDSSFDYSIRGKSSHRIGPACEVGTPACVPDGK